MKVSPKNKLFKKKYRNEGIYPIISQGQNYIIGYTNDEKVINNCGKYIIFGDHTEITKYINFAFAQGADGIKIFKTNNDKLITKYLYYAIKQFYQKKGGYKRHFSFLKKTQIPILSLNKQKKIVKILDKFEILVKDLSVGLPAELKARRQQYEYYRNKLLTFPNYAQEQAI